MCNKNNTKCAKKEEYLFDYRHETGFEITEINKNIFEGDQIIMKCKASKWKYSNLTWRANESKLKTENSKYTHIQTLVIDNISKEDEGVYTCEATDDDGVVKKRIQTLNVYDVEEPSARTDFQNGSVFNVIDPKFTLRCDVTGRPKPNIQWLKDGQRVNQSNFIEIDGQNLKLINLRRSDSGEYVCIATNRGGRITLSMTLSVTSLTAVITGSSVAGVILLICILIMLWKIRVYSAKIQSLPASEVLLFEHGDPDSIDEQLDGHEQADLLPYNKDYEFPHDQLKLGETLGSGAFGIVKKGIASGIVSWEPVSTVAVKMVKPQADKTYLKALMSELKILIHLGKHLNIVNLMGACTANIAKRKLCLIVEYCRFGNIHDYLIQRRTCFVNQIVHTTGMINFDIGKEPRCAENGVEEYIDMSSPAPTTHSQFSFNLRSGNSVRYTKEPFTNSIENAPLTTSDMTVSIESTELDAERNARTYSAGTMESIIEPGWRSNMKSDYKGLLKPVSTKDLICWAFQISRGMEFLASKKVMHGDLACRNILLAEDNVVKICDFGLAKDIYKTNNYQHKPNTKLPMKWLALECMIDNIFSTQSDVWAFGIVLWELFSLGKTPYPGLQGSELEDKLVKGYRMPKPEFAPKDIYKIMLDCWAVEPTIRPSFKQLTVLFGQLLGEGEREHYMELSRQFNNGNNDKTSDLLDRMAAPDYRILSNRAGQEDPYGCLEPSKRKDKVTTEDTTYLIPNHGPKDDVITANLKSSTADSEEETGYMLPYQGPPGEKSKC